MPQVHITKRSSNAKTGRMPVTTSEEANSCPSTCPHKDGNCYAKSGFHLNQHWKKTNSHERGGSWSDLCDFVRSLKPRQIWRHNQAGDLFFIKDEAERELIRLDLLKSLVDANKSSGARGYTYTHHKLDYLHNLEAVKYANNNGFTVNASCETMSQVDDAIAHGIPAVVVVDNSKDVPTHTPNNNKVVVCPAQTSDTNCVDCGLCAQSKRKCAVAFLAHGNRAKKLNATLSTLVQNKEVA